jgi:hypothetical protein
MNNPTAIVDQIRFSWVKTRSILFPFNFRRWFKIWIMASFALVGIGGCSISLKFPEPLQKNQLVRSSSKFLPRKIAQIFPKELSNPQFRDAKQMSLGVMAKGGQKQADFRAASTGFAETSSGSHPRQAAYRAESVQTEEQKQLAAKVAELKDRDPARRSQKAKMPPWILAWGFIIAVPVGVGAVIFIVWMSARFNFVLLETLITGKTNIRESFVRNREQSDSYFRWSLGFLAIAFGFLLILSGLGILIAVFLKGKTFLIISLVTLWLVVFAAGAVTFTAIGTLVRDFIIPLGFREKKTVVETLRNFSPVLRNRWIEVAKYLMLMFAFIILAAIVQSVVGALAAIGGAITGGILAVPGVILLKAFPFLQVPLMALGICIFLGLIVAVIMTIGLIMLPAVIFLRMFALTYLTRLYPECDLLGFLEKAIHRTR